MLFLCYYWLYYPLNRPSPWRILCRRHICNWRYLPLRCIGFLLAIKQRQRADKEGSGHGHDEQYWNLRGYNRYATLQNGDFAEVLSRAQLRNGLLGCECVRDSNPLEGALQGE